MKFHLQLVRSNPCQKTTRNVELSVSGPRWLSCSFAQPVNWSWNICSVQGSEQVPGEGRRESRAILQCWYFSFSSSKTWWCTASYRYSDLSCPLERRWGEEGTEKGTVRKKAL